MGKRRRGIVRTGVVAAVVGSVLLGAPVFVRAQSPVTVNAVLSGQVLPLRLATVGQKVKQGDPLLFVRTTTGSAMPAAAAPVNGEVTQVLVGVGDFVNIGDTVAAVTPR